MSIASHWPSLWSLPSSAPDCSGPSASAPGVRLSGPPSSASGSPPRARAPGAHILGAFALGVIVRDCSLPVATSEVECLAIAVEGVGVAGEDPLVDDESVIVDREVVLPGGEDVIEEEEGPRTTGARKEAAAGVVAPDPVSTGGAGAGGRVGAGGNCLFGFL